MTFATSRSSPGSGRTTEWEGTAWSFTLTQTTKKARAAEQPFHGDRTNIELEIEPMGLFSFHDK
jgi:hypothetical protein